jgi:hypothetical protein
VGSASRTGLKEIEAPNVDRDIQVSREFAGRVFAAAESHKWFNTPCESHLKVAFEGWKTFTYDGPQGQGSCTFNYSRDREIQKLEKSLKIPIGSGYPSDYKTIEIIKKNLKTGILDGNIRERWSTMERIKQTRLTSF